MGPYRTGDKVLITYEGRTVEGSVKLASSNGKSLMLEFEGILGGFGGMMPVLLDAPMDQFYDIIANRRVKIELLER